MREIKFRAWDEKNKLYIFFDKTDILDGYGFELIDFSIPWSDWDQFTGLHDKNGKEIYEGDIVNYTHDKGFNVVVYSEIIPAFVTKDIQGYEYLPSIEDYDSWIVIGNIHENPELIK